MLLSVVVPAYNASSHISTTLNSLVKQGSPLLDIIVVDDGSTDNTVELTELLLAEVPYGNYKVIQKPNGGVSSARNRGLREATGSYVYFLDSDDYVSENFTKVLFPVLSKVESDVICWAYNTVNESHEVILDYSANYDMSPRIMAGVRALQEIILEHSLWIWTGSAVYSRGFLEKWNLEYSEGCANGEDQEFTIKALSRAEQVEFIGHTISYYVKRQGSISNSFNIKRFDVVNAMVRAAQYLRVQETIDLAPVIQSIENDGIFGNFMSNYMSCMSHLIVGHNFSVWRANQHLLEQLKQSYPHLASVLKGQKRSYSLRDWKAFIRAKVFVLSPTLLYMLQRTKVKVRSTLRSES